MRQSGSDEQPGLFSAPRRLFVCTPSKLCAYEECPRRYRYAYVDRPAPRRGPQWAHNSLGVSVHAALRAWFTLPQSRRGPSAVATLLRSTWVTEGYRDDVQASEMFQLALGWLDAYLAHLDVGDEPLGVERVVAAKTEVLALSGRVDRIDRRGDELVIVDYKTGRSALTEDDAQGSRALALYALAAERVFRMRCRRVELHHLPTGSVASHEHTAESLAVHLRRAEEIAEDAVAGEGSISGGTDPDVAFASHVGPRCSWCDYRRICADGMNAPTKEPWAAMADRGPAAAS